MEFILSAIRHHGGLVAEQRNDVADLISNKIFLGGYVANKLGVCGGGGARGKQQLEKGLIG